MKIVIFGLTISSSWGNGHATLWRALCRALADRGHRIVYYERDVPYYANNRDLDALPYGELVLYEDWEDVRSRAADELGGADVGMVTSYCADGVAATRLVLDSGRGLRVFYDLDTPVTLDAVDRGAPVAYLPPEGLGGFDLVLSYTGGGALDGLRDRLGARRVAPLYGSVDPDVYAPVPVPAAGTWRLSYLGTFAEDRQDALNRYFLAVARRRPDLRFLLGGSQYPADFPWSDNIDFRRHVWPQQHPSFYCSAGLTLNVTRAAMARMGYCPSGRLFEAAACGTPIMSDDWEGLDCFYRPDAEILVVRTTEDAIAAVDLDGAELARIARAARERTLDEHTASRRAVELEAALEAASRGLGTGSETEVSRAMEG